MAKYAIYHSDGSVVAYAHRLTQNDSMMGENTVTVSLKSPDVIDWQLGDYIDYRGRRFYMAMTPSVQKQARVNSVGNAIVYDSVKFTSAAGYDLTRCEFRDVVMSAQSSTYHTNFAARTFNFYCTSLVSFAERLKANLDRLFVGDDVWDVYVRLENGTDFKITGKQPTTAAVGKKEVTVSITNQTCWDALGHVKEDFDSFFIVSDYVDTRGKNIRRITLGASGTVIPHYFRYGKDNGVFKFERSTDDSQAVVTVMRAYGNTTNVPRNYYQKKGVAATLNVQNLMLPGFGETSLKSVVSSMWSDSKYATAVKRIKDAVHAATGATVSTLQDLAKWVDFSESANDPYIIAVKQRAKYGAREGCVVFDGGGEFEDIHPSIEWLDGSNKIVSAEQMTDDGTGGESGTPDVPTFDVVVNLGFDPSEHISFGKNSFTVHFNSGMLGGRDFECIGVTANGGYSYTLKLNRSEDKSLNIWFPYNGFNAKANDEYVLTDLDMPDEYVDGTAKMELLPQAVQALLDNCEVRYKYSLTVDNIAMARQHDHAIGIGRPSESVYNIIKAGDELWFGDPDLGFNFSSDTQQVTGSILIDKLEIKEEDGKLPKYSITLVDEVQVGTIEAIQKQIDAITSGKTNIGGGGYNTQDIENIIRALGDARYLRLTGGTVNGNVGINGNTTMDGDATVTGTLHVTKLTADTVEVMEAKHIAGKVISSPAGMVIDRVEEVPGGWKCYFPTKDEDGKDVNNMFAVNDQAFCEQFEIDADADYITSKVYWRLIKEVGTDADKGHYIVVSSVDGEYKPLWSDIPSAGDNVIVLGNRTDADRQNAMISSPVGTFVYESQTYPAPYECQYKGINSFKLPDPINVKSPNITVVNADSITLGSSDVESQLSGMSSRIGGIDDRLTGHDGSLANLSNLIDGVSGRMDGVDDRMQVYDQSIPPLIESLKDSFTYYHIDAVAGDTPKTTVSLGTSGYPDSSWTGSNQEHVGDYVITSDGVVYQFKKSGNSYAWFLVEDKYLIAAKKAALDIKNEYARLYARSVAYSPETEKFTVGTSEVLTAAWLAQLYVSAADEDGRLVTTASLSAYVKEGEDGWVSGVKIQADDFVVDTYNFKLDADGNVKVTGEVIAISGSIGGFAISSDHIKSSNTYNSITKELELSYNGVFFSQTFDNGSVRNISVSDQGILSVGDGYRVHLGDYTTEGGVHTTGLIRETRASDWTKSALTLACSGSTFRNYAIYVESGACRLGGISINATRKTSNYTATINDDYIEFAADTLTLPSPSSHFGKVLFVKYEKSATVNCDVYQGIVTLGSSQGVSSARIVSGSISEFICNGSAWVEIYRFVPQSNNE